MFRGFIRKANTLTGNEVVDKSIKGFNYDDLDLIYVIDECNNIEINTIPVVTQMLNLRTRDAITLEEIRDKFVDLKNGTYTFEEDEIETTEEIVDEEIEENKNTEMGE